MMVGTGFYQDDPWSTIGRIVNLVHEFQDFFDEDPSWSKKWDNIQWMRSLWKFNRCALLIIKKPLLRARAIARRMMISISGWLARKGYKRRTGK